MGDTRVPRTSSSSSPWVEPSGATHMTTKIPSVICSSSTDFFGCIDWFDHITFHSSLHLELTTIQTTHCHLWSWAIFCRCWNDELWKRTWHIWWALLFTIRQIDLERSWLSQNYFLGLLCRHNLVHFWLFCSWELNASLLDYFDTIYLGCL